MSAAAIRTPLPLILIRGFGGLGVEDEKRVPYQGFNDGTVYPGKRGENYIYEGLILRFMKSNWQYQDATNVVGYYSKPIVEDPIDRARGFPHQLITDFDKRRTSPVTSIVIDAAMALNLVQSAAEPLQHAVGLPLLRPGRPEVRDRTGRRSCA